MFGIAAVLALAASLPVVDSVRIESRWGGLGQPSASTYTVERRDGRYFRGSTTVPQGAVDRFVVAITSVPVERQAAFHSIATREWLIARASEPHGEDAHVPQCSSEAKRLLAKHIADPQEALKVLNQYFSVRWTDDYPSISIDVIFQDRRTIHLVSDAQHALMLPWTVSDVETWNPEIPRAVVDLLPDGAEPRLTDRQLAAAYVAEVASETSDAIEEIEERCVHRNFISAVERQFEIVRVYHGSPGDFTAYVRRTDFPPNLVLTLVIRDDEKPDAQARLERAVRRATAYVDRARAYVSKHPDQNFAIWCADGISVDGNELAVEVSEYNPTSGVVSNPRIIQPDGTIQEER
jgi:hypothetical protein